MEIKIPLILLEACVAGVSISICDCDCEGDREDDHSYGKEGSKIAKRNSSCDVLIFVVCRAVLRDFLIATFSEFVGFSSAGHSLPSGMEE